MAFPTTEPDIMAFSQKMLDGYFWHAADFPKVKRILLYARRMNYITARKNLKQANAALKIATTSTDEKLQELKQVMKNCLQKSEVDVTANPEKLKQIGWGPRTEPQPTQLPGQPTDLQLITKESKTVKLKWVRPNDDQPVRNYVVEGRIGGSDWKLFQISYSTEMTLRNQPLGIRLEYRIRAANNAGTGPASNTIAVVL